MEDLATSGWILKTHFKYLHHTEAFADKSRHGPKFYYSVKIKT